MHQPKVCYSHDVRDDMDWEIVYEYDTARSDEANLHVALLIIHHRDLILPMTTIGTARKRT